MGEAFNPELVAAVKAEIDRFQPDLIVASLVGSECFQLAFNTPDRPFDFIVDGRTEIEKGTELVPRWLVRAKLREIDSYIDLVHELVDLSNVPVFYLLPPPPLNDPEAQRAMLEPRLQESFSNLALPSPSLQLRLWEEMCEGIRSVCEGGPHAEWVTVLSPPAGALDKEGFLLTERARDYVHADAKYGAMAMHQVISIMDGARHAPSL